MRHRLLATIFAALLVGAAGLAACSGDDSDDDGASADSTSSSSTSTEPPEATDDSAEGSDDGTTTGPDDSAEGQPQALTPPPAGQCAIFPESPDGRYLVGDAAEIVVTSSNGALQLGAVTPQPGWQHVVEEETATVIEIELSHTDGTEIDFDAEVEPGGVEIELCT